MNRAAISGDIIAFTSLTSVDKERIERALKRFVADLSERYKDDDFFGRVIKGDYVECAMSSPSKVFRIALLLKTLIKSIEVDTSSNKTEIKYFKDYAIRLAVAVAPLYTIDREAGRIDGEAIYLTGRSIQDLNTSGKKKITIKNTLFFRSSEEDIENRYDALFTLVDTVLSKSSAKQSEVIHYKLLGYTEKQISELLEKKQSTISQHSTAAGWYAIEKAVNYFEETIC